MQLKKLKIKKVLQTCNERAKIKKQIFDEVPSKEITVKYSYFNFNTYFIIFKQLRSQLDKIN